MFSDSIYNDIIRIYSETRSVQETSCELGLSAVKVRRVLITEGLWSSKTSIEIGKLSSKGLGPSEIAKELGITEKNVNAYIPYSKGSYSCETKSYGASRNISYRKRMTNALEKQYMLSPDTDTVSKKEVMLRRKTKAEGYIPAYIRQAAIGDKLFEIKNRPVPSDNYYVIRVQLLPDDAEKELIDNSREQLKLKNGSFIFRDIAVPAYMNLHTLHFAIQKLFMLQNFKEHCFSLEESVLTEITKSNLSIWEEYCGILFRCPSSDISDEAWDNDYNGKISISTWLKKKYRSSDPVFIARDSYIDNKKRLFLLTDYEKNQLVSSGSGYNNLNNIIESIRLQDLMVPGAAKVYSSEEICRLLISSSINNKIKANELKKDSVYDDTEALLTLLQKYRYEAHQLKHSSYINKKPLNTAYYNYLRQNSDDIAASVSPILEFIQPSLIPCFNSIRYLYGSWAFKISLIKVIPSDEFKSQYDSVYPICLDSDGIGLSEQFSDMSSYIEFLEQISDENNPNRVNIIKKAKINGWQPTNFSLSNML